MLLPKRDVTAGYEPIMPSYAGILTEGEIQSLTAYIRSLSTAEEKAMTNTTMSDELPLAYEPSYSAPAIRLSRGWPRPTINSSRFSTWGRSRSFSSWAASRSRW